MRLAISNIAWDSQEDDAIVSLLQQYGVQGIELAPTKVYPEPEKVNKTYLKKYKSYWKDKHLEIIAMQSLLFNKSNLSIFGDKQEDTKQYLYSIIEMAAGLSGKALVFGSPKNRLVGRLDSNIAREQAMEFFYELGDRAKQHGVFLCIEANPKEYGCDFITNTFEGLQFIKDINHTAVKLQIDTGTMFINEEDPLILLKKCLPEIGHFHISEPYLQQIGESDHTFIAKSLKDINYQGWVSIEMKNNLNTDNTITVRKVLDYVTKTYL